MFFYIKIFYLSTKGTSFPGVEPLRLNLAPEVNGTRVYLPGGSSPCQPHLPSWSMVSDLQMYLLFSSYTYSCTSTLLWAVFRNWERLYKVGFDCNSREFWFYLYQNFVLWLLFDNQGKLVTDNTVIFKIKASFTFEIAGPVDRGHYIIWGWR